MAENSQNPHGEFHAEYQHIKKDVKRVLVINLVFILLLAGLYVADKKFGFLAQLDRFF